MYHIMNLEKKGDILCKVGGTFFLKISDAFYTFYKKKF
jgi:hypothetical protein